MEGGEGDGGGGGVVGKGGLRGDMMRGEGGDIICGGDYAGLVIVVVVCYRSWHRTTQ